MRQIAWGSIYALYLPAFILALGTGIATPALPVFAKSFDIPFGTASLFIVLNLAGTALSDRVQEHESPPRQRTRPTLPGMWRGGERTDSPPLLHDQAGGV